MCTMMFAVRKNSYKSVVLLKTLTSVEPMEHDEGRRDSKSITDDIIEKIEQSCPLSLTLKGCLRNRGRVR